MRHQCLTDIDSVEVSVFIVVAHGTGEEAWWLRHGSGVDSVASSIGSDELM